MRLLLLFLLITSCMFAAPAYNKTREFKQADGSSFKGKGYGNQHLNWIETSDGEILKYNQENKNFEYATIKNKQLKPSGIRYEKNNSGKVRSMSNTSKLDKETLYKLWSEKQNIANKKMKHSH